MWFYLLMGLVGARPDSCARLLSSSQLLSQGVGEVRSYTREEEAALFSRLELRGHRAGDPDYERFILDNIPLVRSIAKRFMSLVKSRPAQFPDPKSVYEDLISAGLQALAFAGDGFDHTQGYKFSTYAGRGIHNAMINYIATSGRGTLIGTSQVERMGNVREFIRKFAEENGRRPSPEEIQKGLGFSLEVINALLAELKRGSFDSDNRLEFRAHSNPSGGVAAALPRHLEALERHLDAIDNPAAREIVRLTISSALTGRGDMTAESIFYMLADPSMIYEIARGPKPANRDDTLPPSPRAIQLVQTLRGWGFEQLILSAMSENEAPDFSFREYLMLSDIFMEPKVYRNKGHYAHIAKHWKIAVEDLKKLEERFVRITDVHNIVNNMKIPAWRRY